MPQLPPRYDLPRAAPGPLRLVQLFLNTTDHEHTRELLGSPRALRGWLTEQGLDDPGALGTVLAVVYDALRDGSWSRLKTCRNCGWAFWDESRNRSATWCSMQLCGNRLKVRRYRRRTNSTVGR